jgi:hypothetical protein
MNDVFGVMQHDGLGRLPSGCARLQVVTAQCMPYRVEAVRLGRRPVAVPDHEPDTRIAFGYRGDGIDRSPIIGVGADIDSVIVMLVAMQRGSQHPADDRDLVPRGDEHRDAPGNAWRRQACHGQARPTAVPDTAP